MKKIILIATPLLLLISGCKTREDIAREQMVTQISGQVKDSQKLSADFTHRLQELETQVTNISGQTEENQHKTKTDLTEQMRQLLERINVLEANQKDLTDKAAAREQYIQEVLGELKKITGKGSTKGKKLSAYDSAMYDYKKGRYTKAKGKLESLLAGKKVSGTRKSRTIHNLGMIAYIQKDNTAALTYFSKLFTEIPKSGYNKNGLLFLAKTFKRLNQTEEMKQTLNELITRWPKAKQAGEAKKLLK
jgi:TolA-binding protein